MKSTILLIHGFNKTSKDMMTLKYNLRNLGYKVILINLPLTVDYLDDALYLFEKKIGELLDKNEKIHLIGHSTGGILIRIYLSKCKKIDKIGRCVLISTPNKGSVLADIAGSVSKGFVGFFRTLKDLQTCSINKRKLMSINKVKVGAIAGDKNNLILGKLLKNKNDGRVEVNSVKYDSLEDFIILPYNHKEIHYKFLTAQLIDCYFSTGKFIVKEDNNKKRELSFNKKHKDTEKFSIVIPNFKKLLGKNMPNLSMPTSGGKVWWSDLVEYNGWRLQKNKLTGHCRILTPNDYRKVWGSEVYMKKIIYEIFKVVKSKEK